jgi:hypothetical protein
MIFFRAAASLEPSSVAPLMRTRVHSRPFDSGDHACAVYSSRAQRVRLASRFLADGLERHQHSWYIGSRLDGAAVRTALRRRGIDVDGQIRRGALRILLPEDVYIVDGAFSPERTGRVFNDAITQSLADGFRAFRLVADMAWATTIPGCAEQLIASEAAARSLFASARVIALCLYSRRGTALNVLDGALATHPLTTAAAGHTMSNPFYDQETATLRTASGHEVTSKLHELTRLGRGARRSTRRIDHD